MSRHTPPPRLPLLPSLVALPLLAASACATPRAVAAQAGSVPESAADSDEETAPEDAREEVYRPTTSGPFVAYTALITPPGKLTAQPLLRLASIRGEYDETGSYQPLEREEAQAHAALLLFLEYGLARRFSAGAELEWRYQRRREGSREADSSGLADTHLFGRAVLLQEKEGGQPELTLLGLVKLPTGRAVSAGEELLETDVRGTGSTDLTLGVDMTRGLRPILVHMQVRYTHPLPAQVGGVSLSAGDAIAWSLAGEWPLGRGALALMLETSGRYQGPPRLGGLEASDGSTVEVRLGAGVELIVGKDVQLLVGYQRVLWGRDASALDAFLLTLVPLLF